MFVNLYVFLLVPDIDFGVDLLPTPDIFLKYQKDFEEVSFRHSKRRKLYYVSSEA